MAAVSKVLNGMGERDTKTRERHCKQNSKDGNPEEGYLQKYYVKAKKGIGIKVVVIS